MTQGTPLDRHYIGVPGGGQANNPGLRFIPSLAIVVVSQGRSAEVSTWIPSGLARRDIRHCPGLPGIYHSFGRAHVRFSPEQAPWLESLPTRIRGRSRESQRFAGWRAWPLQDLGLRRVAANPAIAMPSSARVAGSGTLPVVLSVPGMVAVSAVQLELIQPLA